MPGCEQGIPAMYSNCQALSFAMKIMSRSTMLTTANYSFFVVEISHCYDCSKIRAVACSDLSAHRNGSGYTAPTRPHLDVRLHT